MTKRENFGSRLALIMAMAGSAIGLGNIWRFPFLVGENGGAAFIIIYLIACFVLVLPIFIAESIIGRRTRQSTFGAMNKLAPGTPWKWLGLLTVLTPLLILSYYSVVGGWSVDYLWKACTLRLTHDTADLFPTFISSTWEPLFTFTVFIVATAVVILLGVKNGIEKFTKICMPALFVLIVIIVVYGLTLPGSSEGVRYLVKPDFSKVDAKMAAAAVGQAFFSLSLGMGTILTYASYAPENENMLGSSVGTTVADLGFALLAGFAIMPAVFAAGIQPGQGPGLVFDTLPYIFSQMPAWIGTTLGIMFFLTILMAALSSSISILEVGVAYLVEEKGMGRIKSTIIVTVLAWILGLFCSLSFGPLSGVKLFGLSIFDFFDQLCSNWLLPLGGLLFTIFVGWYMSREDVRDEFTNGGKINTRIFGLVYFLMRYIAPVGLIVVFLSILL